MLYYVTREVHSYTINRLLASFKESRLPRPDFVRAISYETLFALKRAPLGNYVFTDIDRLSGYEIDAAAAVAGCVARAAPSALISNPPHRVLNRYALLRRLYESGVNSFNVWRLDEERAPSAYPVFIRREHDALGPESPLLHNEGEYRAAIDALQAAGKGLTGRIAVQFLPSADQDGVYRKYGAFCFRGRVVPQHLMTADNWVVKRDTRKHRDRLTEEEERFVKDNPHADRLRRIFELAEIDFGRVDYCVLDGRVEVFEINTNPTFPRARITQDRKMIRRRIVVEGLLAGFRDLDAGRHESGVVRFRAPKPKLRRLQSRSIVRQINDKLTLLRWHNGAQAERLLPSAEHRKPQPESE